MKLLILGGSGFLSGHLVREALAQGHEVWTVTRGGREVDPCVHALTADRSDEAALRAALEGAGQMWDAVLDCICFNPDHAAIDLAVLPAFTGRLIVVSTDSVYAPEGKRVPQDEQGVAYMDDGGYGCMKRRMEETFLAAPAGPMTWTILRPGHIFGSGSELGCFPEHSRQRDLLAWMDADRPLRLVGGGQLLIHPIYAPDLARVMLDCIDKPGCRNEIFCVGGPEAVPNAEYYRIIGELIGHPAVIEEIPDEGYLEAHPQYSGHLCQRAYTLEKLRSAGVTLPATPLREGLADHIAWLRARDADEQVK